jgi:hypothetical protein
VTTFAGRCEALVKVPASTTISVANGGQTAAQTVTLPAADYFMSSLGGLPGLLTTLQTQLNNNVQGYPQSALGMAAAVGAGVYTTGGGYLCNEASGNLASVYGTPATLTANGTPVYNTAGPKGGIDKAIAFDGNTDFFAAGASTDFDVNGTSDLIVAWVGKFTATPTAVEYLFAKGNVGAAAHWTIRYDSSDGLLHFLLVSASGSKESTVSASTLIGQWYVGIAVIDRTAGNCRIGVQTLAGTQTLGASTALFAAETLTNANNFNVGNRSSANAAISQLFSAFYIATGTSAASGMAAGLSAALTNFANAINATWAVSLETTAASNTARVSIGYTSPPAGVPSFSLDWTSTTLRDLLGFAYDLNYADTAAEWAAQIGGTWSAAWHLNEASGNAAPTFGTPTLTASGTITYGIPGPRGGADKAISFAVGTSAQLSGGDVYDVTATDDLLLAWVGYHTAAPAATRSLVNKYSAGNPRWFVQITSAMSAAIVANNGTLEGSASVTLPVGSWYVGMAIAERATGNLRIGYCPLGGSPTVSSAGTANTGTWANAADFTLGRIAGILDSIENMYLADFAIGVGAGIATGFTAGLSTALSNFAATFAQTRTGTQQARGVWIPDCPLFIADSDPRLAPVGSDARSTVSPTGESITFVGNYFREHKSLRWSHCPIAQIREQSATYANASWLTFWNDTQLGKGHSWFLPGSNLLIVDHTGQVVGSDMQAWGPTRGWAVLNPNEVQPKRVHPGGWPGHWSVEFPQIVAKDA